ncbi:hypothetical protein QU487_06970 [Crenobacter sp. SG2305]|uniref:hypothetical protein n=1 Tax=Crenobacter oryzisoli TaxID=3056844 RepID=UPI0025AACB74|nr:hypothetical protein [Crenobacter sp. SG2305]MDN0082497.1 hypothetical protein [Crenobacter sp. SG2305]
MLIGQVDQHEWQSIAKLMEYGLRITSIYQIMDGRISRELLNQAAKTINPDICRQGKTASRAPLHSQSERLLTTLVAKVYIDLRAGIPMISMAEAVAHLYEQAWTMSKMKSFKRPLTADEVYAIVRSLDNGQIKMTMCKGTSSSYHPGTDFSFVVDREEPIKGLCPWCAVSARKNKKQATESTATNTTLPLAVNG